MIILALDSALSSCSAAVIKDDVLLSDVFEDRLRGQAERLLPLCQQVCTAAGVTFDQLDAIAVTRGPGTFTGVRIGLAAAKGLALALKVPLIGMTTLEVVAHQAANALEPSFSGQVAVAHDARRGEVYYQSFAVANGALSAVSAPMAVPLNVVAGHVNDNIKVIAGTGAGLLRDHLPEEVLSGLLFPDVQQQPTAAMIGHMAVGRFSKAGSSDTVTPLYLRAPDAIAAAPITYPFQNQ